MRIFLLPLTTRQAFIYCQRITPKPAAQRGILDKILDKTTDTWAKWEAAEKGWQNKVVTYGNKALQRIPYQEWGLKSFPASNPDLQAKQLIEAKTFEVIYPGNVIQVDDVPKILGRLARERKQLHFNRFVGSLVGMPFTIPFALIPIIPNLPFFYITYRAWSHWKALKGSDHLDFLLDHRLLKPISTPTVESIYKRYSPNLQHTFDFATVSQLADGSVKKEQLLLPAGAHVEFAKRLEVPELSAELERAIWQVEQAAEREQRENERLAQAQTQAQAQRLSERVTSDEKHEKEK